MSIENYRRIIRQWCDATGMSPWQTGANIHVDIDNTTVGLIYDAEASADTLHVFFDLGLLEFPDVHRRLLELNMTIDDPSDTGWFALHPLSGAAVYRWVIALTPEVDGAALLQQIADKIIEARERVQA